MCNKHRRDMLSLINRAAALALIPEGAWGHFDELKEALRSGNYEELRRIAKGLRSASFASITNTKTEWWSKTSGEGTPVTVDIDGKLIAALAAAVLAAEVDAIADETEPLGK